MFFFLHSQILDTVAEIQERHDAVRDLERKLLELQQVMPFLHKLFVIIHYVTKAMTFNELCRLVPKRNTLKNNTNWCSYCVPSSCDYVWSGMG
jgi:hypothetical protein